MYLSEDEQEEMFLLTSGRMRLNFKSKSTKAWLLLYIIVILHLLCLLSGTGKRVQTSVTMNSSICHRKFQPPDSNIHRHEYHTKEQESRKKYIYKYCRAVGVSKPSSNDFVIMAHNSKFNVSYIAIPKIGSTFLKQMFFVLKYGPTYANQSFSTPRNIVHINFIGQRKRLYFYSSLEETVTVVAVRNPFSRLFSAYIDKVYLPNCIRLLTDILAYKHRHNTIHAENYTPSDQNDKQGLTITFLDFLNYALDPFQKKKIFWDHYEPCFPQLKKLICNSKRYIVVKQETFEADITYVLQSLGVNRTEHETYNIITRSLYESRVEDSIPGIIKETFAHAKENAKLWTGHIVAERLWHSFQIQGLIDQQIPFPETYFNFKLAYSNVSFILDVFLKVMQGGKLSRAASLEQRKEAMLSAYKALPKHVIQNVNDMYDCDFKAFGYNTTLFSDEIHLKRSENVAKLAAYKI